MDLFTTFRVFHRRQFISFSIATQYAWLLLWLEGGDSYTGFCSVHSSFHESSERRKKSEKINKCYFAFCVANCNHKRNVINFILFSIPISSCAIRRTHITNVLLFHFVFMKKEKNTIFLISVAFCWTANSSEFRLSLRPVRVLDV